MRAFTVLVMLGSGLLLMQPVLAQAPPEGELRKRVQDLEGQVQDLRQELEKKQAPTRQEFHLLREAVEALKPGLENFLLTGYAFAEFREPEGDEDSTFATNFNPIFLWKLGERLLFEAEMEIEIEDGETEVGLEYAQILYIVHDYVTVGVGKFLLPAGIFPERLHPAWITKLPTFPLPFQHHGGIVPFTDVGAQVRGGFPLGGVAKANYAIYVTNGPRLLTTGHHAGELRFDNTPDNNNSKAVGGRIGLLPIPALEVGFSYQWAEVGDGTFSDIDADLIIADLSFVRDAEFLGGRVDLRFEWVRQKIDDAVYTVDDEAFAFDNEKKGWYVQIAYRPTLLAIPILENLEGVFRYTRLDWAEGTPLEEEEPGEGVDREQFSIGLNYWLMPSAVVKIAYNINDNLDGAAGEDNLLVIQVAYGF
ncbi:MAG: hypothetical protein ACE5JU_20965 [Candidatus Binatia bacterium]